MAYDTIKTEELSHKLYCFHLRLFIFIMRRPLELKQFEMNLFYVKNSRSSGTNDY